MGHTKYLNPEYLRYLIGFDIDKVETIVQSNSIDIIRFCEWATLNKVDTIYIGLAGLTNIEQRIIL